MFQSYQDVSQTEKSARRVDRLRRVLRSRKVDGFIIPRADEYQGEYVAAYAERLAWLTGFTGSAGTAIIMQDKAVIFIDGRYTIQAGEQVDTEIFQIIDISETSPAKWLKANIGKHVLGFDPWLTTSDQLAAYKSSGKTKALFPNPIDEIWQDQPARPSALIFAQPMQYAGQSAKHKIAGIKSFLKDKQADAVILTLSDSISWLFNIRGREIAHNPVVLAYAIIRKKAKPQLFIDPAKIPDDMKSDLLSVTKIIPPDKFTRQLKKLGKSHKTILLDPASAPCQIARKLKRSGAKIKNTADPCILPKAKKNKVELQGARNAHIRDGAVMAKFLYWLKTTAASSNLDEISVAKKLEQLRISTGKLVDISFDTISAAGPHAAIPHYRVTTASNIPLEQDRIYLVDSGAQYHDGTTDITRTVIIGNASDEMKTRFTQVLKGMICLSLARFPKGTNGAQLDILARQYLWASGLDFDHGTGHGVGSFLSVHEGPARISKAGNVALETGMILSNEPGFYKQGEYGIRIENLFAVTKAEIINGGDRPMHSFETLTLAPIDRNLIDVSLLSETERNWLNSHHKQVFDEISPLLTQSEKHWLQSATKEI